MGMKYRTKLRIFRSFALVVVMILLLIIKCLYTCRPQETRMKKPQETCYAIITGGERFKYVYFISELLRAQGVKNNRILIFHDTGKGFAIPDFIKDHPYKLAVANSLTALYKQFFHWVFVEYNCEYAVVLEDDIFPGADAVEYFEWGRQLMQIDKTVLSVSGSHDNAEARHVLHPGVFVKAEQFMGLGWLTSRRFYSDFFSQIDDKTSLVPWDKQLNTMMDNAGVVSVFPHLPRTVHMPWGTRHGELVTLQLSFLKHYSYVPIEIFNDYHGAYVNWLKEHVEVNESHHSSLGEIKTQMQGTVKYPFSFLANRPFGFFDNLSIFPTSRGPIHLVYKD